MGSKPPNIEELMVAHLAPLTAFIRVRTGPALGMRESISDLVQSTCREILENTDRELGDDGEFRAWLYITAERKIKDKARFWNAARRAKDREGPVFSDGQALLSCYQRFAAPSADAAMADEIARVESSLQALPEDYRDIILLHFIVGLTHEEIGQRLDRSAVACRKLLSRALARLAQNLMDEDEKRTGGK